MNQNNIPNQQVKLKDPNKPIYIIIITLLIIIVGIIIVILVDDNKSKNLSRTIMIYMVGSDLESKSGGLATVELEGLDYNATSKNNINVLLIAGGSKYWHNDYIDEKETSIYKLESTGFKKVKQQSIKNMGDPNVLSDFLNYVYNNYKSDKYELSFWNHGGAITGSEYDEINNNDHLELKELSTALNNSPFKGRNKLELIYFETCLNGTIEMANVFKEHADYLVASEETTLSSPTVSELTFLNQVTPSDDAVSIGKQFISTYKAKIKDLKEGSTIYDDDAIYSTYSILRLKNIDPLLNSISAFFSDINKPKNFNNISKVRANLLQYGSNVPGYDMVDLYNLVNDLKTLSPKKGDNVLANLEKTIVYNYATDSRSRGLSVYFPYNGSEITKAKYINIYNNLNGFSEYQSFIKKFTEIRQNGGKSFSFSNNSINISGTDNKNESDFSTKLDEKQLETFASAKYIVYRDNKNGYYKPIYINGTATLEDNTLTATIKDKQLKVKSLVDNSSTTLILNEVDNNDKFIKYSTGVMLQKSSVEESLEKEGDESNYTNATINLAYEKKSKKIDILNTLYDEENFASTAVVDLSKFYSVYFSISSGWDILDENGNYVGPQYDKDGKVKSDGIITGFSEKVGQYKFELETFDEKYDYYCVFIVTDIYGNKSHTKLVKMNNGG